MTILLHPNKENPKRYRVWDKEMKVQAYYKLDKQGLEDAKAHQAAIDESKRARMLKAELPTNKLFNEDGSVKGLKRIYRQRKGRKNYECLSLNVTVAPGQQKSTEIIVNDDNFEDAYAKAIGWLLTMHNIKPGFEVRRKIKKARRFYWQSVAQQESA